MFELKVPYLSQAKIESAANELLRKFGKWKGAEIKPPIDIDEIIEGYFGLQLTFCNLEEILGMDDVLGATWFDDQHVKIASSLEDKEGRLVFTMAHEAGHWWLHRPIIEMDKVTLPLFSRDDGMPATPALVCRSSKKPPAEWQADQFAACLLMQASAVRGTVQAMYGDSLPAWKDCRGKAQSQGLRSPAARPRRGRNSGGGVHQRIQRGDAVSTARSQVGARPLKPTAESFVGGNNGDSFFGLGV